jgi:hypothetical protein
MMKRNSDRVALQDVTNDDPKRARNLEADKDQSEYIPSDVDGDTLIDSIDSDEEVDVIIEDDSDDDSYGGARNKSLTALPVHSCGSIRLKAATTSFAC